MAISTRLRAPSLFITLVRWSLDRAETDVELGGDLGVGPAASHREHDLLLEQRQWFDGLRWRLIGTIVREGLGQQDGSRVFEQEASGPTLRAP